MGAVRFELAAGDVTEHTWAVDRLDDLLATLEPRRWVKVSEVAHGVVEGQLSTARLFTAVGVTPKEWAEGAAGLLTVRVSSSRVYVAGHAYPRVAPAGQVSFNGVDVDVAKAAVAGDFRSSHELVGLVMSSTELSSCALTLAGLDGWAPQPGELGQGVRPPEHDDLPRLVTELKGARFEGLSPEAKQIACGLAKDWGSTVADLVGAASAAACSSQPS